MISPIQPDILSPDGHISKITEYLYISAWPRQEHIDLLTALNVGLMITVNWQYPPRRVLRKGGIRSLWLPALDNPLFPIPVFLLEKGVRAALPVIEGGEAVLVHCTEGKHRSVAQAACILIAQEGISAVEAMQRIKAQRTIADPDAPHIQRQIRKFEARWRDG